VQSQNERNAQTAKKKNDHQKAKNEHAASSSKLVRVELLGKETHCQTTPYVLQSATPADAARAHCQKHAFDRTQNSPRHTK
jgi:hypothetical protein